MNGSLPEGTGAVWEVASDGTDSPVISSYADARAILVSASARVPADRPPPLRAGGGPADSIVERGVRLRGLWMWGCEADRRLVRRKSGTAALGPASLAPLIPYLDMRASELLAAGQASEIDLVTGFAEPFVRDALMELLGVPPARRAVLDAQVQAMAGFIPGRDDGGTSRYFALAAAANALEELWRGPLPPLAAASRILRGAVESAELALDEALAQATLLLFGNSYTTLDALSGLLARLADQPAVWQAARNGSLPVAGLIEESLRLGPPSHLVLFRDAEEEIECPGGTIAAGTRIVLPLNRINRDPAAFDRADGFEPGRSGPPHLAFGAGRNMCVGLHLARTVIRTAVEALLRRLPEWPAETRIKLAPGVLGGPTVAGLVVPPGALERC